MNEAMQKPKGKLAELVATLGDARRILVMTHNNPDPDAIGAAFGLRRVLGEAAGIQCVLGYAGTLGRAENRAMVRLLRIPLREISTGQAARFKHVALVDGQPRSKNVLVKPGLDYTVVIDHHLSKGRQIAPFMDLREQYGATSSIVAEYARENDIALDARTATALYYGVKSDVADLAREIGEADIRMMQYLFPKISMRWLTRIERARVPAAYFRHYASGINNALVIGDVVASDMGRAQNQELIAELADFLMKSEGARWTICSGVIDKRLCFSLRTTNRGVGAGRIAAKIAGKAGSAGGHEQSAGGFIPLSDDTEEKVLVERKRLLEKFCRAVGRDLRKAVKLVPAAHPIETHESDGEEAAAP